MIKKALLVSACGLIGLINVACNSQKKEAAAPAVAAETAWCLDGFERPAGMNPVIRPLLTKFYCPMREDSVAWEESDTFNPAATIYDGKIVVMYRAEDNSAKGIGSRTSRLGYATSTDGVNFERDTKPAFYPAKDNQEENECPGGTEDPRIAMTEDGTYVLLYTQWNRKVPRLAVATSKDLKNWTKFGPAFGKAYDGKFKDEPTKSASLVTALKDDRQVITKVNGKYFMYWGEKNVYAATSDNLTDWDPLLDENGELLKLFSPRAGYFDSQLTECGPPAILTKDGILLLYNGKNEAGEKGDPNYPDNAYCAGQALFDAKNPTRLIGRLDKPFLQPADAFEKSGQYPAGTVFVEGLVYYKNKWFLYYGCADSFVAVAVSDKQLR